MYGNYEKNYDCREIIKELSIHNLIEIYKMDCFNPNLRSQIHTVLSKYAHASVQRAYEDEELFPKDAELIRRLNR